MSMPMLWTLMAVAAAYLVGSLSFAVVVSRVMGLADPRTYGSKNPGATNVLRSGNRPAAALTLLGDALKGWLAVWLVQRFGGMVGVGEWGVALAGVAVFLGHLYPIFFGFKGGKGVATAAGVIVAFNPWLGLATGITWLIIAFFFRYSSLASLVAAVFAAFYSAFGWGFDVRFLAICVIAGFVVYRHRGNIAHLMAGTERRIGDAKGKGPIGNRG
jgi:acyl phosphate:glycerol-3-phosphate acyltransferase